MFRIWHLLPGFACNVVFTTHEASSAHWGSPVKTVRVFTTCGLLGGVQGQAMLVRLVQRCKQLFVNVRSVKMQIILHLNALHLVRSFWLHLFLLKMCETLPWELLMQSEGIQEILHKIIATNLARSLICFVFLWKKKKEIFSLNFGKKRDIFFELSTGFG